MVLPLLKLTPAGTKEGPDPHHFPLCLLAWALICLHMILIVNIADSKLGNMNATGDGYHAMSECALFWGGRVHTHETHVTG